MPARRGKISFRLTATVAVVAVVAALSVGLTACSRDDAKALKAAKWLKTDSKRNKPNGEWVTTSVTVDDDGRVVMDVLVPFKEQIDLIKSRTRIDQVRIVMLACPAKGSQFWTMIERDRDLWINLTARTKNGMDANLQGATCKR